VANDEEHALMILEAQEKGLVKTTSGPPLTHWTPEAERLDSLIDAVRTLIMATANAAGGHLPQPKPTPRPTTALERVKHRQRMLKHEALVARVKRDSALYAEMHKNDTVE
jgi:hypothetical protein